MARQTTGLGAQRPIPGIPISPTSAVGAAAAVTSDLPADSCWRASKPLCNLAYRPSNGHATRYLFALFKLQCSWSSSAWRGSNASIDCQHPLNAALVPPLKRSGDVRHTLTALPSLPKLYPLFRREPRPCIPLHRSPPNQARLEGVASIG